jgi:hypothetical protein
MVAQSVLAQVVGVMLAMNPIDMNVRADMAVMLLVDIAGMKQTDIAGMILSLAKEICLLWNNLKGVVKD